MEDVLLGGDGPLHEKGLIGDPASKAKSVVLSADGLKRSEALFYELFGKPRLPV